MDKRLDAIAGQVNTSRDRDSPPLEKWHPALSGDIPIRITADGRWYHDGGLVHRSALVRLFASILRREADGHYYLVTPVEKWRIQVDLHPLVVTDTNALTREGLSLLEATLNTGIRVVIGSDHPLSLEPRVDNVAVLSLRHGLTALFSRPAWYRLVGMATAENGRMLLRSGNYQVELGPA